MAEARLSYQVLAKAAEIFDGPWDKESDH